MDFRGKQGILEFLGWFLRPGLSGKGLFNFQRGGCAKATFIALMPKKSQSLKISDFRHIS